MTLYGLCVSIAAIAKQSEKYRKTAVQGFYFLPEINSFE